MSGKLHNIITCYQMIALYFASSGNMPILFFYYDHTKHNLNFCRILFHKNVSTFVYWERQVSTGNYTIFYCCAFVSLYV